jgi:Family of unknown function (DUF6153)
VPMAITNAPRICRWVAVVVLALGLVAMHHLVSSHTDLGDSHNGLTHRAMLVPPAENGSGTLAKVAALPGQPGTDGGLMLHLCQAVLSGLVLLAGLSLAWWLLPAPGPDLSSGARGKPANRQRAPPTVLRLACLGVLRL